MSAIDRALDILEVVARADGGVPLADIAAETNIAKPTAHRILQTLTARGFVRQDDGRSYSVGSALLRLGGEALSRLTFADLARPALRQLRGHTAETIYLARLVGSQAVYVDKRQGPRPYTMASKLGDPLQLHCTAIGKAILANLPAERRDELLQGHSLPRRTENTITSHSKLKAELRDVRRQGFAHDDEENEVNVRCVGAPVFDAHADVIGAISISAPTFELSKEAALALAPAVMEAGRSVSLALGAPEDALPAAYRR